MKDPFNHKAADWAARLGTLGVWSHKSRVDESLAVELEMMGFGTLWVGGSPDGNLDAIERILDATSTLIVATGVVNIWNTDANVLVDSYHRIASRHPDRLLLGIGAGHPERAGVRAQRPLAAMRAYVETLVTSGVPRNAILLAALGPRALTLGGSISAGVHTYSELPRTRTPRDELSGRDAWSSLSERSFSTRAPTRRALLCVPLCRIRISGSPTTKTTFGALGPTSPTGRAGVVTPSSMRSARTGETKSLTGSRRILMQVRTM